MNLLTAGRVLKTVFVEEAARLLGVSRRTVYNRIRDGRLLTIKTTGGTRRVVVDSITALLREELRERSSPLRGGGPREVVARDPTVRDGAVRRGPALEEAACGAMDRGQVSQS